MHDERDIQFASVDKGFHLDSLVGAGIDGESGFVQSGIRGRFSPLPGVGVRRFHLDLAFDNKQNTSCRR